jgi:CHAT domain-containing protein
MQASAEQVHSEVRGQVVDLGLHAPDPAPGDTADRPLGYAHPCYWAPFILMST